MELGGRQSGTLVPSVLSLSQGRVESSEFPPPFPPARLRTSCSSVMTAIAATTCTVSPPPCRSRRKVSATPPAPPNPIFPLRFGNGSKQAEFSPEHFSAMQTHFDPWVFWGQSWICHATIENDGVHHSGCSPVIPLLEKQKNLLPPQNPSPTSLIPCTPKCLRINW